MTKFDRMVKNPGTREMILNILDIVQGQKIYDVKDIFGAAMHFMNSSAEVDIELVKARIEAVGAGADGD